MQLLQLAALLPLLVADTLAQSVNCRTTFGTKPVNKVPSTTVVATATKRPTQVLLAPRKTVTSYAGQLSTSWRTRTKTDMFTETTDTDTYYVEATYFAVETFSSTTVVTTTTTQTSTTSSTSTTVSPTVTGFLNVKDTLNRGSIAKRKPGHPHEVQKRAVLKGPQGVLAQSFPNNVKCTKTVPNTNTYTTYTQLGPVTETMLYWSKTTVKYTTQTITSTIVPDNAKETITETTTSNVQTTTTIINTQTDHASTTTTSIIPGPTVYDACNERNYFGATFTSNNDPFYAVNVANNGPGVPSDFYKMSDGATTITDCCNACQRLKTCETFLFRKKYRSCFLLAHEGATCSSPNDHPNFVISAPLADTDGSDGYVVGNGNCGYVWSGEGNGNLRRVDGI